MDTPDVVDRESWEQSLAVSDLDTDAAEAGQPDADPDTPAAEEAPAGSPAAPDASSEAAQPTDDPSVEPQAEGEEAAADEPGEEPEEPAQPDEPEAPAAPDPNAIQQQPFGFKVDGVQVDVPGAIEAEGYIAIPRDAWDRVVQPKLADRRAWQRREDDYRRQITDLSPDRNADVQQARKIVEMIDQAVQGGADGLYAWALGFVENLPVLKAEAKAAALEARVQTQESAEQAQQRTEQAQQLAREMEDALRNEAQTLLQDDAYSDLGLDAEDLFNDLWAIRSSLFAEVTEDDPARGLKAGQIVYRRDLIRQLADRVAKPVRKERERLAEVEAARKKNQRATQPSQVPPAVPAKGTPASAGRAPKAPTNKDEWEASLRG